MKEGYKKKKKAKKKENSPSMVEVARPERKSVTTEKVDNGYIVRCTDKNWNEKISVFKTEKEAIDHAKKQL